ncbi:MAG: sulfatase [Solirubrobacterales bacterium]
MPKRRTRATIGALASAALLCSLLAGPLSPAQARKAGIGKRPNILVVMTDDQALADMQHMPNVEKLLVRKGTSFTNAVDSFPLCCPARATFITGQYAHNHGVAGNFYPYGWYGMKRRGDTLPHWLQKAGYRTALIGKWLNGYGARDGHGEVPVGFSIWRGLLDVSAYDYFNFVMNVNGKLRIWGDREFAQDLVRFAKIEVSPGVTTVAQLLAWAASIFTPGYYGTENREDYSPDVTGAIAQRLVRRQAKSRRPFFIWWAPAAPHREDVATTILGRPGADPRPAPRYRKLSESFVLPRPPSFNYSDPADPDSKVAQLPAMTAGQINQLELDYQGRLGSLRAVDDHVRRIVQILRETGQFRNTLIVFLSDNGWVQGQHRIPGDKFTPYEESILVPFVLRGPGIPRGRTIGKQVSNIDFARTLLDAAGARPGRTQDGISLLPVARHPSRAPDRAIELEATAPLFAGDGFPMSYDQPYQGVRTSRYKYVVWSYGARELYDLRKDPYEMHNKVADPAYASIKRRLQGKLKRLEDCKGAACIVSP